MKYHLVVLGCQMNHSDSERVERIMTQLGFVSTQNELEADVIGIIACSVRQKAIDKVYSKIVKWNRWKNKRNLITFVSGCILPDDRVKFLKSFDLVFDMKEIETLPTLLREYGVNFANANFYLSEPTELGELTVPKDEVILPSMDFSNVKPISPKPHNNDTTSQTWNVEPIYHSHFEAFVPIQNGCNKFCTFCAVPYTRGREVSRSSVDILDEISSLVNKGYKSITLLGQNVNSYGLDKKGEEISFAQLLEAIGKIVDDVEGDIWVYYTSPHPRDITRDVIEVMAKYRGIAKQIHLPLQSGDEKVLIKMNRKHSLLKYREIIGWVKELIPTATIFTDIIVGFTGETDEQFNNTRLAMTEFEYSMAYIAMYSPRPGAASFAWSDDVEHAIKKVRFATLTKDLTVVAQKLSSQMVGNEFKLLVRGRDKKDGFLSGHTEGKIIVRFASTDESLIGKIVTVKIESAGPFSCEATLVSSEVINTNKILA